MTADAALVGDTVAPDGSLGGGAEAAGGGLLGAGDNAADGEATPELEPGDAVGSGGKLRASTSGGAVYTMGPPSAAWQPATRRAIARTTPGLIAMPPRPGRPGRVRVQPPFCRSLAPGRMEW